MTTARNRRPAPGKARSQLKAERRRRARRRARLAMAGWLAAIAAIAGLITATALTVGQVISPRPGDRAGPGTGLL